MTAGSSKTNRTKRSAKTTPMMEQYLRVKAQHPDALLLYRMGDFYETFFEDAVTLSRILGIVLTTRNRDDDDPIPLAGIPWHSAEPQIAKLLKAGLRVAICEQVESSSEAKGLLERRVVEVLSPGTAVTENLLEGGRHNFLAALCGSGERLGFAAADISTGTFLAGDLSPEEVEQELMRTNPAEILTPIDWVDHNLAILAERFPSIFRTEWDPWRFSPSRGESILKEHFGVATLEGYGFEQIGSGIGAAAALLEYGREQKQSPLSHLTGLERIRPSGCLILDEASLRGLEVLSPLIGGGDEATLVSVLDRTRSAAGGRLLRQTLARPFRDPEPAEARLDRVASFFDDANIHRSIRDRLGELSDIERILGRTHCGRANPRDLAGLRKSLLVVPEIQRHLPETAGWSQVGLDDRCRDLAESLDAALVESPGLRFQEEVFRDGYDDSLDSLRNAATRGKEWMAALELSEREATGITNLKVGYNRVFGYYLEVTKSQISRVPERYIRKQTLSTGERYVTPELKEQEERLLGSQEAQVRRQEELFRNLCAAVVDRTADLQWLARRLAEIDLVSSFADAAIEGRYQRPSLDRSQELSIEEGRHPAVERSMPRDKFVANDAHLDTSENQIMILTGPNMAGKSTYLRQVGLIVLMAQAGSFVPARAAKIGVCDRIFTRVGAHDILARGQSTFLVEMIETSNILRNATSESLVLMDEVGRGTSTYDGVSIAWAVAEGLRERPERRPRVIFATHYHELTRLGDDPGYRNLNVLVREWGDQVIFLRQVVEGAADRSYGIEVARLAGVPERIVTRASEILRDLERGGAGGVRVQKERQKAPAQLPLFASAEGAWLLEELSRVEPEKLTPLEALELIHRWVGRIDPSGGGTV